MKAINFCVLYGDDNGAASILLVVYELEKRQFSIERQ